MKYRVTDYVHFARLYARNRHRQRMWGKLYEASVRSQTFKLPAATVVQLIPSEACNCAARSATSGGENGYFFDGIRHVEHMNEDSLIRLMRSLSPCDSGRAYERHLQHEFGIIAGNVFRDGFMQSFNSDAAVKFRKHMLTNRLPICNRCCGLYMTNPARKFEQKSTEYTCPGETSNDPLARKTLRGILNSKQQP